MAHITRQIELGDNNNINGGYLRNSDEEINWQTKKK